MPLVSVVTPVHNGEAYLAECIESVRAQTFTDWEYIIVDNCSTDRTRIIAERYVKDPRIRIESNSTLLPVIANYNRGASLVSPGSRYLKYVAADDLLFPECLTQMVALGESHPDVKLIASYKIHGDRPVCEGPAFPQTIVDGRDVCRWFFEGQLGLLGGPTNHLIRLPTAVCSNGPFDEDYLHADIELYVRLLSQGVKYGFVHQVLTFTREHASSVSVRFADVMGSRTIEFLAILQKYGRSFLADAEWRRRLTPFRRAYARFLVRALMKPWNRQIWTFQAGARRKFHVRITTMDLMQALVFESGTLVRSPMSAIRSVAREYHRVRKTTRSS
jgi:glycosyltransferase involved in cell wall biosynthesis